MFPLIFVHLELSLRVVSRVIFRPLRVVALAGLLSITIEARAVTFNATGAVQTFTASQAGYYKISAVGGSGGAGFSSTGGAGATASGTFFLSAGTQLQIAVGGAGSQTGGGGGSFVYIDTATPLVVAGGGGAAPLFSSAPGRPAVASTSANTGGANGLGGTGNQESGGGAGFFGDGGNGTLVGVDGGKMAPLFTGGALENAGAFGGGGGGGNGQFGSGGGGGGYSGGNGGTTSLGGGGGGSFVAASYLGVAVPDATKADGSNVGDGTVTVNLAKAASLTVTTTVDTIDPLSAQTSLREALAYANSGATGANPVIRFTGDPLAAAATNPTVANFYDGTARTITLGAAGELAINSNVTIAGPGADRLTLSGNNASRIFTVATGATVVLDGLQIANGLTLDSDAGGGAIYSTGNLTLTRCLLTANKAYSPSGVQARGGAIVSDGGSLTLADCRLTGNEARKDGGSGVVEGGAITAGNLTMRRCVVDHNTCTSADYGLGGALDLLGTALLVDCSFHSNSVTNTVQTAVGGAIGSQSSLTNLTAIGCTFSDNSCGETTTVGAAAGGAISAGTVNATNCTFTGNVARAYYTAGGAILCDSFAPLRLQNCTIVGNQSLGAYGLSSGGGGVYAGGSFVSGNTIIAQNTATPSDKPQDVSVAGTLQSLGHNFIGRGEGGSFTDGVNGDQVGTATVPLDPFLGPLADHGGLTQTRPPLAGSPAIDAGADLAPLGAALADNTTSIGVPDARLFPGGVGLLIQIDAEQMLVLSTDTNANTLTVQRGVNNTTATTHSMGAAVNYAFDQRGLARVLRGKASSASAVPDIGAYEVPNVPAVQLVNSAKPDGSYKAGEVIDVTVQFDRAVTVTTTAGTPTLTLDTGANNGAGTAVAYLSGSGTDMLTFRYTVAAGDNTADLEALTTAALALNGGTITDADGFGADLTLAAPGSMGSLSGNRDLVIDTTAPTIAISAPSLAQTRATPVTFTVTFTGADAITLANGDVMVIPVTGNATGAATVAAGAMANERVVTVSGFTGVGTLKIAIAGGTANDLAGNLSLAAESVTFTVDTTPLVADDFGFTIGKKPIDIDVLLNDPAGAMGAVAIRIVTPPQHGTATIVGGKIHYVPNGKLPLGGDVFTYQYDDGHGGLATATVTVVNIAAFAGTYDGLINSGMTTVRIRASGLEGHERSGYLRVTISKTGRFSGVLTFAGTKLSPLVRVGLRGFGFSSQLGSAGQVVRVFLRRPGAPITLTLQYDAVNRTIVGTAESVDSAGQPFISPLELGARTPAGTLAGRYAFQLAPSLPGANPAPTAPGTAAARISAHGDVRMIGRLGDGAAFSSATTLHDDESFAIYAGLYGSGASGRGSLRGVMQFPLVPTPTGDATGTLDWFKPARPRDQDFPLGFDLSGDATLAR